MIKAHSISETGDGWWRVMFDNDLGILSGHDGSFFAIRDWIKESLIYETGTLDDYWRIGTTSSLDFKREEDGMMCFVRYA